MHRNAALKTVAEFQRLIENAALAGSGHPDLFDWHEECAAIARERMVRRLTGDRRRTKNMPAQPEIRYD